MDADFPNPYHRYPLTETAYLADAAGARYVAIAPDAGEYAVERGHLDSPTSGGEPACLPVGAPARFRLDALAVAVQRFCTLAADWLDFDEWEVEQTRRLFIAEVPRREDSAG